MPCFQYCYGGPIVALTIIDVARGLESFYASFLVVEDAVDAAVLAAEPKRGAGRAAAGATALAAPDRAACFAVGVLGFITSDPFAGALLIGW